MARLGRYFAAGQALHVIQRGNDRQRIFFADDDRVLFHAWLAEAARAHRDLESRQTTGSIILLP